MKRIAFLFAGIWFAGCSSPKPEPRKIILPAQPLGKTIEIKPPLGLPPLPIPPENPPTAETIALGERLFVDKRLSADATIACSNCHDPRHGFTDAQPVSTGIRGQKGNRSAPTVINAAYVPLQFWDGRAEGLEAQAFGPIYNEIEMGHSLKGVEKVLSEDAAMRTEFEKLFGPAPEGQSPVTMKRVTNAIAAFERTVLRGNSPFDRYFYGKDKSALSPAAVRGLEVFRNKAKGNCATCHTIEKEYALFTDNKFHNLGVGIGPDGGFTDLGRYLTTKGEGDQGAFRTPTLRNITETAPYMHDGSLKTLKDVVDFYVGGGTSNPFLDKEIKALSHLTKQERADLVTFMESLTGTAAQ